MLSDMRRGQLPADTSEINLSSALLQTLFKVSKSAGLEAQSTMGQQASLPKLFLSQAEQQLGKCSLQRLKQPVNLTRCTPCHLPSARPPSPSTPRSE
mmetsp:Transcript_151484/g.264651  ORF Transcript_151484/g.264651 Transcript_151484/m.264651 type:complete len:97 (+) Transcript_151484:317-607(+)